METAWFCAILPRCSLGNRGIDCMIHNYGNKSFRRRWVRLGEGRDIGVVLAACSQWMSSMNATKRLC